uniref:Uncharacterized protein n=1 Tax=Romanomermis culicivorax TaxID=13658 RepID=A0A915IU86_ROMCU
MMLFEALWLLLLSACCILNSKASVEGDTETFYPRKLVRDVTEKLSYDYRIRPVRNYSKPINVSIRMNLYQIVDVNERSQHVSLYMWIEQKWRDEFLRWDPQEYEGLNSIIVPYDRVWLPDTYLYNSLEMVRENTERWISVVLTMEKDRNDSSLVSFRYPAIYRYTCNMDILFFPFDEQRCTMSFGSWLYDSAGIDYHPFTNNVIMNDFIPSEEWSVLAFTCKRHLFEYKCCKVPFSVLVCDLILHRKPLHYLVNLVVPTLIITLISFVGFFSPATTNGERTEKVNLGITTLLAMSILLLMVSDQMPTTSNFVPLIGWFYLSVILLISIATVLTALIIMLQKNGYYGHRVPDWLKKFFFVHVARILCMKTPVKLASMVKYAEAFKMENEMSLGFGQFGTSSLKQQLSSNLRAPLHQRFKDHELRVPLASCDATPLSSDRNNYEKNMSTSTNDFVFERQMSSANKKFSNHYTNNHNDEQNLNGIADDINRNSNGSGALSQLKFIQRQLSTLNEYMNSREDLEIIQLEWEWLSELVDRFLLASFVFIALSITAAICFVGMFAHQNVQDQLQGDSNWGTKRVVACFWIANKATCFDPCSSFFAAQLVIISAFITIRS